MGGREKRCSSSSSSYLLIVLFLFLFLFEVVFSISRVDRLRVDRVKKEKNKKGKKHGLPQRQMVDIFKEIGLKSKKENGKSFGVSYRPMNDGGGARGMRWLSSFILARFLGLDVIHNKFEDGGGVSAFQFEGEYCHKVNEINSKMIFRCYESKWDEFLATKKFSLNISSIPKNPCPMETTQYEINEETIEKVLHPTNENQKILSQNSKSNNKKENEKENEIENGNCDSVSVSGSGRISEKLYNAESYFPRLRETLSSWRSEVLRFPREGFEEEAECMFQPSGINVAVHLRRGDKRMSRDYPIGYQNQHLLRMLHEIAKEIDPETYHLLVPPREKEKKGNGEEKIFRTKSETRKGKREKGRKREKVEKEQDREEREREREERNDVRRKERMEKAKREEREREREKKENYFARTFRIMNSEKETKINFHIFTEIDNCPKPVSQEDFHNYQDSGKSMGYYFKENPSSLSKVSSKSRTFSTPGYAEWANDLPKKENGLGSQNKDKKYMIIDELAMWDLEPRDCFYSFLSDCPSNYMCSAYYRKRCADEVFCESFPSGVWRVKSGRGLGFLPFNVFVHVNGPPEESIYCMSQADIIWGVCSTFSQLSLFLSPPEKALKLYSSNCGMPVERQHIGLVRAENFSHWVATKNERVPLLVFPETFPNSIQNWKKGWTLDGKRKERRAFQGYRKNENNDFAGSFSPLPLKKIIRDKKRETHF